MTRPIKFRAWVPHRNDMYDMRAIQIGGENNELITGLWDNEETFITEVYSDAIFMQFTGLLDRNGKEIYEGDIHKLAEDIIAVVVWDESCGAFQSRRIGDEKQSSHLFGIELIEVIGNIYSNPELITQQG